MKRKLSKPNLLEQNHHDQQPDSKAKDMASGALKGIRELYGNYILARNDLSSHSWKFDQYCKDHSAAMKPEDQKMLKEYSEASARLIGGILDPRLTTSIDQLQELENLLDNPNPNTALNSSSPQDVPLAQVEDIDSQAQLSQPLAATCQEVVLLAEPAGAAAGIHGHH